MPRDKHRHRGDRSSSSSSVSSYEKKKLKSKHKRRSRSRSSSKQYHHRRTGSHSKYKRSYSRSVSRERYESKSKKHNRSRDHSRSRSSSRSRSKYSRNRRKSRSPSRSSTFDIEPALKKANLDDNDSKVEKAINAAKAAGLTMIKLPSYEQNNIEVKEDMPTIYDKNILDELNSDSFQQKSFASTKKKKKSENIVIDLNAETIVNIPESKVNKEDSIINFDEIPSEEELKEMWIKKLYQYRKKMLRGEI